MRRSDCNTIRSGGFLFIKTPAIHKQSIKSVIQRKQSLKMGYVYMYVLRKGLLEGYGRWEDTQFAMVQGMF